VFVATFVAVLFEPMLVVEVLLLAGGLQLKVNPS
jgi:hypothetical protein